MKPHLATFAVLVAGCGIGGLGGGGDDEPPPDGKPSGLTVRWEVQPENIPGDGESGARIERVVFRLANLRVVGDTGPLQLGAVTLEWATGVSPTDIVLGEAPSGLYSRCLFEIAPTSDYAYEILGTIDDNGEAIPFTIRDRGTASILVDYSIMLPPGGEAEIPIRAHADDLVDAVDFGGVTKLDGRYLVEDGSPQLAPVRVELARAFSVQ